MSQFLDATSSYARRYQLSTLDKARLLSAYPLFKILFLRENGSEHSKRLAVHLVPAFENVSLSHRIHGRGGSMRLPLRLQREQILNFREIFQGNEYPVALDRARSYVDAGANAGFAAAFFAVHYRLERMLLIEPNPELKATLQRTVRALPHHAEVEHVALAPTDGEVTFSIYDNNRYSRVGVARGRSVTVPSRTLRGLLDAHGFDQVDILKMDIEGSEHDVLASDPTVVDRVKCIVMELHGSRTERDATGKLLAEREFDVDQIKHRGVDTLIGVKRSPNWMRASASVSGSPVTAPGAPRGRTPGTN